MARARYLGDLVHYRDCLVAIGSAIGVAIADSASRGGQCVRAGTGIFSLRSGSAPGLARSALGYRRLAARHVGATHCRSNRATPADDVADRSVLAGSYAHD